MPFEQIPYTNFHGTNQDWMIQQIKQMIANWAIYRENLDAAWADYQQNINSWRQALDSAFNSLHDYVYTYFDELDVQQEINNKLDQMREDGVFDDILLPYFNAYTTNINNTVETQNNRINTVENEVNNFLQNTGTLGTEKDPELIDIRVSYDGRTTYPTAGDAVRGQVGDLKEDLNGITSATENVNVSDIGRFYVSSEGVIKPSTDNYLGLLEKIPCKANTSYTVRVFNAEVNNDANYFYMAWYDDNETFIIRDSQTITKSTLYATFTSPSTAEYMYFDFTNSRGVTINENTSVVISEGTNPLPAYIPYVTAKDYVARSMVNINVGRIDTLEENVTEIKSKIDDGIPSYFEENLATAVNNIRQNMGIVGVNGDSFVFVTDPHWGINTKHTPKLIKKIISETELLNVVCGGDALDSGTKESELNKAYDFMKSYNFADGGLKYIFGNHDHNQNQHGNDSSYWLSSEEIYSIYYAKAEKENIDVHCNEGKIKYPTVYCYFDSIATKTRYLNLGMPEGTITQAELTWINDLLTNNPNMNFVLFAHYLFNPSTVAFTDGANSVLNIVQNHDNVHAVLFGHIHADLVRYSSKGIPIVATDTDAYSRLGSLNPNTATEGTITELAFDNVTVDYRNNDVMCARVGRGKNRYIRGGVNAVSINGNITLSTVIDGATWETLDSSVATVVNGVVTGIAAGNAIIKATGASDEEYWYIVIS